MPPIFHIRFLHFHHQLQLQDIVPNAIFQFLLNLHAGFRNYRDFIVQSLSLIYPTRLPSRNSRIKRRDLHFIRNASASVQPLTEDLVEETSQDLPMSGNSIRRRFLEFYAARGHKILPSSSLVPDDPTVLLTIAGMLQFKPVFLGKVPRQVPCATTSQKCIRTNDIENVGRTSRHHTFFEMLGNFSFGDYFKKEAIKWAWELSTIEYGLTAENLWISVYEHDEETYAIWHDEIGVPANRIKKMGEEDNFWTSGLTGPCGPCSEIYYDFHPNRGHSDADLNDDTRFIEFYNLVFMQFNKKDDGSLEPLKQKNIDTGMGLERMARILQKVPNNYETDLIFPIIEKVSELANVSYALTDDSSRTKLKVIGDHMRAIVYLISDGVFPSNIGRGYVVRRLIRRAVRTGRLLGIRGDEKGNIEGAFLPIVAEKVHHTATHLLQAALKKVIGEETSQAGSLVAFERLRFDFNFHRQLVDHELTKIEGLVNEWIGEATPLETEVMPIADAKNAGAIAMFGEKYGEEVRVVNVPGVSMELCGGTHVSNTSEIRGFKIISEQGIASGIRRIEAVAGDAFIEYVSDRDNYMKQLCSTLKVKAEEVPSRVAAVMEELRMAKNEVSAARAKTAVYKASVIANNVFHVGTSTQIRVLVEFMDDTDADSLKSAAEYLVDALGDPSAIILGSSPGEEKVSLVAAFSPSVVSMGIQAGKFIGPIAKMCGGGGGGRANFAQAGGRKPENLSSALEKARTDLVSALSEKAS
ncbi:alanine--tRNA ligase, chloroplastic/mitochondrial isoform X4 [Cynara cardunculus var. scolymus]|uniref:alanine--tRNA ligase, chloroplastic/mitochondrial isoform X4 n=1 Tax=Cynara cardunculus var. scolymus TaxID=59895 RepID=UPI000D62705D|nr:alanine--tRNA ligase, chloroplastic/mitochondrial isoform X4 [Cynara cardunculus var. scolymus]